MEVFHKLMVQATTSGFKFHPKCERVNLTHLCFADDLMIFTAGDLTSIQKVKSVLEQFKEISGLQANSLKSEVFLSGVSEVSF